MPLQDHFRPPLRGRWPWSSVHGAWATFITQQLNQAPLPEGYYAIPNMPLGGQAQIDVATVRRQEEPLAGGVSDGALATALWAPPKPPLVVPIDFADPDVFEVQVFTELEGVRLVAAIELVSPANKDRPSHRRAFAAKCAAYIQQNIGV